jgi:hypothetical protein
MNVKRFIRIFKVMFVLILCTFSFMLGGSLFLFLSFNVSAWFLLPLLIYLSFGLSLVAYLSENNIYLW